MQKSRLAYAIAGVALFAGASTLPTAATAQNSDYRHRIVHRVHYAAGDRDRS